MTTHNGRLTRLESLPPPAERGADWSRLTTGEYARYREIEQRVDAVRLDGLTDADIEDIAALAEKVLGNETTASPPPTWPRSRRPSETGPSSWPTRATTRMR